MHTLTLVHSDLVDYVTGNGQTTVEEVGGENVVEQEIERYRRELKSELGDAFDVVVSARVLQEQIDGHPARFDDLADVVSDAEARLAERFW